jgi:hypothetical protein
LYDFSFSFWTGAFPRLNVFCQVEKQPVRPALWLKSDSAFKCVARIGRLARDKARKPKINMKRCIFGMFRNGGLDDVDSDVVLA